MSYVAEEVVRVEREPHPIKLSNSQVHRNRTYLRHHLLCKNHQKDRLNPEVEVVGLVRLPTDHMVEELLHVHQRAESSVVS